MPLATYLAGIAEFLRLREQLGADHVRVQTNRLDFLYQFRRPVQISVLDCISRENREFCYFGTFTLAEVSPGAWR